jgi:hypothetical protein
MSHFSVLVITPAKPDEDELQRILLPWHEYECTGIEEYLVDVDITDEVTEEFNRPRNVVILASGEVFSRYDERFYTKPPKERWGRKEFELPPGAEEAEWTAAKAREHSAGHATMADAAEYDYGESAFARDGRWYRRTNPNKKWDWWTVGGRWSGRLENGAGACDQAELSHINMDAMLASAQSRIKTAWHGAAAEYAKNGGCNGYSFSLALTKWNEVITTAREKQAAGAQGAFYQMIDAEPEGKALRVAYNAANWHGVPDGVSSLDEALATARPLSALAVVKDGEWHAQSRIGWFGVEHDAKETDAWQMEFNALLADLPPTTWLTIVDCHI